MILTSGLPARVFTEPFTGFAFAELDWASSADFWPRLQQLSENSDAKSILVGVLEPDPVDYFFREFGCYPFSSLALNRSADDYWEALTENPAASPADAILYNSDVLVWLPDSVDWAIWGQRDIGACVIGFNTRSRRAGRHLLTPDWMSVDSVLTNLIPINFKDGVVPYDFAEMLRANYSVR